MAETVVFIDGLRAFKPNDNAPAFIKANLEIEVDKLTTWLSGQSGKVKLQLKESKKGGWYLSVDTYQRVNNEEKEDLPF